MKTVRGTIRRSGLAFINGRAVPAVSGQTFDVRNPADGSRLAQVADCAAADVDAAVSAARKSFESECWAGLTPRNRKHILLRFASLIEENLEELAWTETEDVGKPISLSREFDIPSAIECLQWYAEAADKIYDEVAPVGRHVVGTIVREPKGVVGAIVPWNYPTLISMWKIAPALAVGNSVVLKPSELAPMAPIRVAELALEAGIPEGVLNVVPGTGASAGKALASHPDVDAIAFTGSTTVGRQIMKYAADSNLKSVTLELGGKSPNIIFADYADREYAAEAAAMGAFLNQGQTCNAGSRVLIQRSCANEVIDRIVRFTESLIVGSPGNDSTNIGPLISPAHADRVSAYVTEGKKEGATLLAGGSEISLQGKGRYMKPTVFSDVDNKMKIAREEIFGPVLSIIVFDDDESAVRIANDSPYGLAAGLWTTSLDRAHRVSSQLKAGYVWINAYHRSDIALPFGGYKQSGFGRDKSLHAIEKFTNLKSTLLHLS